jgi:hypothetical protein
VGRALDHEEAAALGELILVRDAWCPAHGRVRPESIAFPFTITRECLVRFPPRCAARVCEETVVLLDAEQAKTRLHQTLVVHEDERGAMVAYDLLPVAPGLWVTGVLPRGATPQDERSRPYMVDLPSERAATRDEEDADRVANSARSEIDDA